MYTDIAALIQARLMAEFSIILAHEEYRVPGSHFNDGMFSASRKGAKADNNGTAGGNTEKDKKEE